MPLRMTSLNKVMLIGRLGRDPEERTFEGGGRIVTFSLATSERYKDRQGERQERTDWHRIVIRFPKLADTALQLLRKGMLVYVEGELRYREYTPNEGGERRQVAEIFCRNFTIMEPKREESTVTSNTTQGATSSTADTSPAPSGGAPAQEDSGDPSPPPDGTETDDLPF